DEARYNFLLKELQVHGFVLDFKSRIEQRDGSPRWISENVRLLTDEAGNPSGFQGVMRDITGEREAEDQLRLMSKVFQHGIEGILITDTQNRILQVNHAFTYITVYQPEEVLGKTPAILSAGYHESDFYTEMWKTIASKGYWQGEVLDRRKSGELYTEALTITEVRNSDGEVTNYIGIFSDISDRKATELQMHRLAYYDLLTDLPNRRMFHDRLEQELHRARRENKSCGVIFIDLDNFKFINDSYGHRTGDDVLKVVAERFQEVLRESDTVARLGGDEFTVLVPDITSLRSLDITTGRLSDCLKSPIPVGEHEFVIGASIGLSVFPDDAKDGETLLKNADAAMYRAKSQGRGNIEYFTPELNIHARERVEFEMSLRYAIERTEFIVHYQPQFDLTSGKLIGAEALVRWNHPVNGLLYPDRFIAIAEESGLIDRIGNWVLEESCRQGREWHDQGMEHLVVGVNISPRQFATGDLLNTVRDALRRSGLQPQNLELEITESVMMENPVQAIEVLCQLRELGVCVSIDDFGTGFSSLSYLKRLPVTRLKIDRQFVCELNTDHEDRAIVASVVDLAKHLGLGVIAEGVETEEQSDLLQQLGCSEAQGYLFSKPINSREFGERFINSHPQTA
ncbi:MAG: EAL domain-containing protein, partial [Sedimenticola sp.]